jgi:ubiquitin-conjugating enzyme E2 variant
MRILKAMSAADLPRHDEILGVPRAIELASIVAAGAMLLWQGTRLWLLGLGGDRAWLVLVVVAAAMVADLVSGLVHWTADTWGSETLPFIGRRFLRPFRVHHVNPADFNRRDFIDTNGDVSMLVLPSLVAAAGWPIEGTMSLALVTGLVSFAAAGWMTNQVHQWSHVDRPPRVVAWMQRHGLLLSRAAHGAHHTAPHATNYCIANGWMNRPLAALGFFRRLEALVTRCTGVEPRRDDAAFAAKPTR